MVKFSIINSLFAKSAVKSSIWLILEKFILMLITFVVGIFIIRYLDAEEFGYYSFILSIYVILEVLCTFGLNNEVVKKIVSKSKYNVNEILGTAYIFQLMIGIISCLICFLFFWIENSFLSIELIVFIALPIKAFRVISYYFDANVLGKFNAIIRTCVLLFVNLFKVLIILFQLPIEYLYLVILIDACLFSILYSIFYYAKSQYKISSWSINFSLIKSYCKVGWALMLTSFIITLYLRIDQVMITSILGNFENGIYSSAIRISSSWYNIGWVIVLSFFPNLIKLKEKDDTLFNAKLEKLIQLMVCIGLIVGISILFLGNFLVELLFTEEYKGAVVPLKIHIWSTILIFIYFIQEKWYIIHNKENLFFLGCSLGLIINCTLNLVTLKVFGIQAAAYNTIVGLVFSLFIFPYMFQSLRTLFYIQIKAIFSFYKLISFKNIFLLDGKN